MNLYISLKWLEEHIEVVSYEGMWHETETDEFVSVKNIHSAPSIDIEPKRGEWIYGEHDVAMCDGYRCNRCDFFVPWDYEHKFIDFINDYHFCPNCGADMREVRDE